MAKPTPTIVLRKPPIAETLAKADAFVEGERGTGMAESELPAPPVRPVTSAPAPSSVDTEIEQITRRRTVVTRQDGRRLHRTTIYVPPDLSRRLSVYCAQTDQRQSDVVVKALRRFLDG